jgi:hypothetical protein
MSQPKFTNNSSNNSSQTCNDNNYFNINQPTESNIGDKLIGTILLNDTCLVLRIT